MRARILVDEYEMEFEGSAHYWNECMRPIFGGPVAKEASLADSKPAPKRKGPEDSKAPSPDSRSDPSGASKSDDREGGDDGGGGDVQPARPQESARRTTRKAEPVSPASPKTDTELLYADLAKADGRRAEKDAVLATVWLLGGTVHDVTFDAVARQLHSFELFRDVRVKPHLLKHCSRSHMLEPGAERETVRMTKKGIRYIAGLMSQGR